MNEQTLALRRYIADWDPMGFINDLDAPVDEYDAEADEIMRRISGSMSIEQVGQTIHKVFADYMEIDPPGFEAVCLNHAKAIMEIIRSKRQDS